MSRMQDPAPLLSGWKDIQGRPFDGRQARRWPRIRSLRGLARQARARTLESVAAEVAKREVAFGLRCGCGRDAATVHRGEVGGFLPEGWEWRGTSARDAAGPLPDGFSWVGDEPDMPGRPEVEPAPPADGTAGGGVFRVAVNTLNFFEYELTKGGPTSDEVLRYGPVEAIVADLAALGVQVARHPGRIQLMLDEVLGSSSFAAGYSLPFALGNESAVDAAVRASPSMMRILDLVDVLAAHNADLKLIITLISLGGGSTTVGGSVSITEPGDPSPTVYTLALPTNWEDSWKDQELYDDITGSNQPFNRATPDGDATLASWDASTLDPRNPAKRVFYRWFARAIGRWLQDHEDRVADHIAGIEILNEAEIRQAIQGTDGIYPDGAGWGRFYYYCASALREQCDWVPLWLPGLASYGPGVVEGTILSWTGKLSYLDAMLGEIEAMRTEDGDAFELGELVDGLDYHWYHRARGSKSDPKDPGDRQLLLYLPLELAELRETFDRWGLQDAVLTVTESAVNVLCTQGAEYPEAAYPWGCEEGATGDPGPDYRPPLVECPAGIAMVDFDEAPANSFQGAMVWMRLAAALVGGARIVGWHTHIARQPTASFAATGLRQDLHGSSEGIESAGARASWYAMRFAAGLLSTVTAATLLWPPLEEVDRTSFASDAASGAWPSDQLVWVVELEDATHYWSSWIWGADRPLGTGSMGWWAYLLFIDGTPGTKDLVEVPACATVRFSALHGANIYRVPLAPESLATGTATADAFPPELWASGVPDRLDMGHRGTSASVRLGLGQWPTLLLSSTRLSVAEVSVSGMVS